MWTLVVLQMEPWPDVVSRLGEMGRGAERGALNLLVALAVLLLGWALATLASRLVGALLRLLRFDAAVQGLVGARIALRHEPASTASWMVFWLGFAFAALLALEMLGINIVAPVGDRLNEIVPRIVTSAVLFAVGSLFAMLLGSVTRRFLESAGLRAARLHGQVVTVILTGFAALLGLDQLGFAAQFVMALGIVTVAAAGLGLALAFGLGCRDLARDFVVEYLRSLDEERPKRPD